MRHEDGSVRDDSWARFDLRVDAAAVVLDELERVTVGEDAPDEVVREPEFDAADLVEAWEPLLGELDVHSARLSWICSLLRAPRIGMITLRRCWARTQAIATWAGDAPRSAATSLTASAIARLRSVSIRRPYQSAVAIRVPSGRSRSVP